MKFLDITIIQDGTGCEIHDANWDKKQLDKFLAIGWTIKVMDEDTRPVKSGLPVESELSYEQDQEKQINVEKVKHL